MIAFKMALAAAIMTVIAFYANFSVMSSLNEQWEQNQENEEAISLMVVLSTIVIYFISNMATVLLYRLLLE